MSWFILVVDDSAMHRAQLREFLETKGVQVCEAENGVEGLWRARERPADMVITDVHMPLMDGIRFTEELRKLPEYTATPILVLTSDASTSRGAEGSRAGATAWVVKPVDFSLLWMAIEKMLEGEKPEGRRQQSVEDTERSPAG